MKNGYRKWLIAFMFNVCCSFYLFVCGMRSSCKQVDVDYSFYLGPDYKEKEKKVPHVSTIVCNHVSFLDPVVLIKMLQPAFAPSVEFSKVPIVSNLIDAIDSIYIPRGGSAENRAKALEAIRNRQELIEETGKFAPFLIFAEGGTTNGTGLIKFKKGGFFAEKTIRPVFLKYSYYQLSPAFDTMELLPLLIFMMSWACYCVEVNVMPDFQPNEYMFETHANKGEERWEIFAWAARDIMAKTGDFSECNNSLRQKLTYEAYMHHKNNDSPTELAATPEENVLLPQ